MSRPGTMRNIRFAAAAAAAVAMLAACSSSKSNPLQPSSSTSGSAAGGGTVTVGSANFPENVLLGEIYAEALEAKGIKVSRKLNIGARDVIYKQLESGGLTVVPEYNGALLAYLDKTNTSKTKDDVDKALTEKLGSTSLALLNAADAQDNDSLVVSKANADKYHLTKISDLSAVAKDWVLGSAPEFKTRQQGLVGLQSEYGLAFKSFKPLDNAGPTTVAALKNDDAQVVDLYSTTPAINTEGFVVLTDDKSLFGVQNVIPLYYKSGLSQAGQDALNAVSAKLDTPTLTLLMKQLVTDKKDAGVVAKDWLTQNGLTK
jgi:osmoprotectant transport system substrate-binding protein